jgi:ankyrin repeat protein
MVEREEVDKILSEQELGASGLVSSDTAAKIGSLTGAKVLVTGRLFAVGNQYMVVAKIISTETSRVYGVTATITDLANLPQAAKDLSGKIDGVLASHRDVLELQEETSDQRLQRLRGILGQRPLPSVTVTITERDYTHPWNIYQYTLGDMFSDIEGNGLSASVRLNFLENVWPLINQEQREDLLHPQGISMPHYAATFRHLADEIGDPKRVWDILATPPLADATPPSAKAAIAPTPIVPQGPTLAFAQLRQHLIDNNKPPPEPLLSNIAPVEAPPTEMEAYSPDSPSGIRLRSFADQLIIGKCRYDMSTEQEKPLSNAPGGWGGFAALSGERVFYFLNEGLGWLDLSTGDSGKFSFHQGIPVSNPSIVGTAGQRYLFVGGGAPPLAGYYDFQKQSWLTPAHDPFQDKASNGGTGEAIGNDQWMLFPQWSMLYNVKNSEWRDVSTVIIKSEEQGAVTTEKMATYFGQSLALDHDFLLWNKHGIVQYSPDLNRVVWSAKATNLQDVASDGPYIWLLFSNSSDYPRMFGAPPIPESSTILLVNRTDKTNLGAWKIPYGSRSLCLSDNEVWLTSSIEKRSDDFSNSSPQQTLVWRGEKKDFYEALNLAPPPPNKRPPRPSFFPSRGTELYEDLIRQNVDGARELLDNGVSANSLVGVDQAPALNVAVWTRNSEMVKLFLNHGVDLSGTALEIASKEEDPAIARLLITAGANPDGKSSDRSALSEAVRSRNIEVVKLLAKAGAQLLKMDAAGNLFDPHGGGRYGPDIIGLVKDATMAKCLLRLYPQLPLYWKNMLEKIAAPDGLLTIDPNISSNLDELCRAIVDSSNSFERSNELIQLIPKDKLNDPRVTALVAGKILFGQTKIVGAFLAAGVDLNQVINTSWPDPKSPLSLYFDYSRHADMLLFLMDHGYDPTKEFSSNLLGFTKLAYWDRDPVFWNELLRNSINLSQKCGYGTLGSYGLVGAVDGRNGIAVRALLAHGANPNAVGPDGYSPLQMAFSGRSPDLACLLAGSHAELNFRDLSGRTIFDPPYLTDSYFVQSLRSYKPSSDIETIGQKILLSALQGRPTYNDLFDAVSRQDTTRVKDLLQRGAPIDTSRELYQKPGLVFLASQAGAADLVKMLLDHASDPNIGVRGVDLQYLAFSNVSTGVRAWPISQSPLMEAAKLGNAEIIGLLIEHGAYAPALDEFGRTAIDQAANPQIAKLISDRTQVQFLAEKLMTLIQPPLPAPPNWPDLDSIHQIVRTDPSCVNVKNATGVVPLLLVASFLSDSNKKILKVFQDCGCGMDALDASGMTPLHHAVLDVDDQRAADLVKLGFSPLTPDSRGITALDLTEGILDDGARSKMITILRNPDVFPHSDTEAHSKSQ